MSFILQLLREQNKPVEFARFFTLDEGRSGVVVTFIAMLELIKEQLVDYIQSATAASIYLHLKG